MLTRKQYTADNKMRNKDILVQCRLQRFVDNFFIHEQDNKLEILPSIR